MDIFLSICTLILAAATGLAGYAAILLALALFKTVKVLSEQGRRHDSHE